MTQGTVSRYTANTRIGRILRRLVWCVGQCRIARALRRRQRYLQQKRRFHARMRGLEHSRLLDVSHRPDANVIFVVIDCLRNSQLSCQGYPRHTTPFLDSLQCRFTAITASPWTYPSVATLLTGLYPHNHKAVIAGSTKYLDRFENFRKLGERVLTLPEALFLLGYETYFASAIWLAHWPVRYRVVPQVYDQLPKAGLILDNAARWIHKRRHKPFFAYLHLGDLHQPLNPPDSFRSFFGKVKDLPNIKTWDFERRQQQVASAREFQEYRENRKLLYDNTLRYVDSVIERFYYRLEAEGIMDSTILVVTADHGEELWDHAELEAGNFYDPRGASGVGHGHNVFNEIIEVPLLMAGPLPSCRTPDHYVSLADVVPTIADVLGIRHSMKFDGRNIFRDHGERPLLSEACAYGHEKKALIIGRRKVIYSPDDGVLWAFDLADDPKEQDPITDSRTTSALARELSRILAGDERARVRRAIGGRHL